MVPGSADAGIFAATHHSHRGYPGTPFSARNLGHNPRSAERRDRLATSRDHPPAFGRTPAGAGQRCPTFFFSVDRFQKTTTHHQLQFTCSQSKVEASIDPQRIEQVLANLLTNALKYSPQGSPVSLTLDLYPEDQEMEIRVQDHGIGIPLHQQARIFGRFMRAGNAQAAGIRGTGLGLYLCRALVEQHDGRLWFESQEGVGSTFFLRLPLTSN